MDLLAASLVAPAPTRTTGTASAFLAVARRRALPRLPSRRLPSLPLLLRRLPSLLLPPTTAPRRGAAAARSGRSRLRCESRPFLAPARGLDGHHETTKRVSTLTSGNHEDERERAGKR